MEFNDVNSALKASQFRKITNARIVSMGPRYIPEAEVNMLLYLMDFYIPLHVVKNLFPSEEDSNE